MKRFGEWLAEAMVRGSVAGEAMKKTLDFKVNAEWIKWSVEPKGWITDKGVKDSFDFSAAFYNPKVQKPAFFYVRAHAILEKPDAEYDSVSGSDEMEIMATMFVFNGRTGLPGRPVGAEPRNMKELLDRDGHIRLSERNNRINFPGALSEFDGPSLKTPLQLADWINKVISHTDIGGDDGEGEDEPDLPEVPDPSGRRLVGV
ncbi:hypothetical protein EBT16_03355 [bacterium]|nr:hypothetical protein [bacterium]